jgi:large subunit ribosomal protein L13
LGKTKRNTNNTRSNVDNNTKQIIVDASYCIAGRVCSHVSKLLLQGNRVSIINSEKAMLSGNRYSIINEYKTRLEVGSVTNPIHGPYHPRRPDRILTKMVRAMTPRAKPSGVSAFRRLRVYVGIPNELGSKDIKIFDDTKITKSESYYMTIGDVAKEIGWKGE